jgi:hypothetical protein
MRFFMITDDVFCGDDAGAYFDLPYEFPRYNIL